MKVTAFNGSARKDGNTAILINIALEEIRKEGIDTKLIQLSGAKIRGCMACYKCTTNLDKKCAVKNDELNGWIAKMEESDGIIFGSPTYFTNVTSEMSSLINRAGLVARANGDMFKHKAAAAVVSMRRGGATHAYDSINHFFLSNHMIVPGTNYWNIGIGRDIGDVLKDEEGILTMQNVGKNMAWLLKKIHG
jgi:multimeric flavodoxin WrbA